MTDILWNLIDADSGDDIDERDARRRRLVAKGLTINSACRDEAMALCGNFSSAESMEASLQASGSLKISFARLLATVSVPSASSSESVNLSENSSFLLTIVVYRPGDNV